MKILTYLLLGIMIIAQALNNAHAQNDRASQFFPFNLSGLDHFKKGDFKTALNRALAESNVKDTAYRLFKLGVINTELKNDSKALFYFRLTAQKSPILAPFAYEYIGDIENRLKDPQNSLNAYRYALSGTIPQKYKESIFSKIRIVFEKSSSKLPSGTWLEEYREWLIPQLKQPGESLFKVVDSIINKKDWYSLDSILNLTLQKDPKSNSIIKLVANATMPDSALSTVLLFSLAQSAYSFKEYPTSLTFFQKSKSRVDFSKVVNDKIAAYFESKLYYFLEDYSKAITLFKDYESKYGPESEILMLISRAYRKLGNEEEALKWYSKHIKLYPEHPKTQEILWLMAWRMELLGRYKEAASYYSKITTDFKVGPRIEESFFRRALCYFKRDDFDSTIITFNSFINKYPVSSQIPAAQFWKAKSLLALDQLDSAKELFKLVANVDPYDYYANRSRQLMQLLGDTSEYMIDSSNDTAATLLWLDTISPSNAKKILTTNDSISLYRGITLLSINRIKEADIFLEQLEQSFPGNLELQFKLALAYQNQDASMQAFRVARRLTWRIPQKARTNLPFLIYKLFYPSFYSEAIKKESSRRNVDPFLVSAVIRQESVFNPTIVSPAGAIGLMQIMPYTGKDVAKRMGEKFTNDSLYLPFTNIRYGTSYLRELLDEFNDNIVLVIAGYNGGPINAKRWFEVNKDQDFDLFIEDIEFTETRTYVKKVLSNYWTYRLLSKYPGYTYGIENTSKSISERTK